MMMLEHQAEDGLWCRSRNEVAFLGASGRVPLGTRPDAPRNRDRVPGTGTTGRPRPGAIHQVEYLWCERLKTVKIKELPVYLVGTGSIFWILIWN